MERGRGLESEGDGGRRKKRWRRERAAVAGMKVENRGIGDRKVRVEERRREQKKKRNWVSGMAQEDDREVQELECRNRKRRSE